MTHQDDEKARDGVGGWLVHPTLQPSFPGEGRTGDSKYLLAVETEAGFGFSGQVRDTLTLVPGPRVISTALLQHCIPPHPPTPHFLLAGSQSTTLT